MTPKTGPDMTGDRRIELLQGSAAERHAGVEVRSLVAAGQRASALAGELCGGERERQRRVLTLHARGLVARTWSAGAFLCLRPGPGLPVPQRRARRSTAARAAINMMARATASRRQAPGRTPATGGELSLLRRLAGLEEGLLRRMQLARPHRRPLQSRVEPQAPVELVVGLPGLLPGPGCRGQPAVQPATGPVLLQPRPQPGPLPQEGLMSDLGARPLGRHGPVCG